MSENETLAKKLTRPEAAEMRGVFNETKIDPAFVGARCDAEDCIIDGYVVEAALDAAEMVDKELLTLCPWHMMDYEQGKLPKDL